MHTYASDSQEARELLADLEYLWDQIKDLQPTSSDDSIQGLPSAPFTNRHLHSHAGSTSSAAALTTANLISYNQQNLRHPPSHTNSHAGSYASIENKRSRHGNKRSHRHYPLPENLQGIPASSLSEMYRAESYMSGQSYNSNKVREARKGKGKGRNKNFIGSQASDVAHDDTQNQFFQQPYNGNIEISQLDDPNLEMTKWRRDVTWALETINEEIMAIRERYGTNGLLKDSDPLSQSVSRMNEDSRKMRIPQLESTGAYNKNIIYRLIHKGNQLLALLGILPAPSSSGFNNNGSYISDDSSITHRNNVGDVSPFIKVLKTTLKVFARIAFDIIVLQIVAFLAFKVLQRYPQLLKQKDGKVYRLVQYWDYIFKRILLLDPVTLNLQQTTAKKQISYRSGNI